VSAFQAPGATKSPELLGLADDSVQAEAAKRVAQE
jgi:hypothetical protein